MRTLRYLAALPSAAALTALLTAAPASAGGGAGMTLTASMSGQGRVLPLGSLHTVWIQVTDSTHGEATLEHVSVTVSGGAAPVMCDRGANGTVKLVPGLTVGCATEITAGSGRQSITVQATAVVAGGDSKLVRSVVVSYQGSVPKKPVAAPATTSPHAAVVRPTGCLPSPSPAAGPVATGEGRCAQVSPTASPTGDCAVRTAPAATSPWADCAKPNDRSTLAFTGTQIMGWGIVATVAFAAGVILMMRHRKIAR